MSTVRPAIHRYLQIAARLPVARALVYVAEAVRLRVVHGDKLPLRSLIADYAEWRETLKLGGQPLANSRPWLTFGATHFLESRLERSMRVFEYGCGGSTIFLALRIGQVISVEHDRRWSDEVTQTAAALGIRNATVLYVEATVDSHPVGKHSGDPDAYVSSDSTFAGRTFREYASAIDSYADSEFEAVLIDGRARPSCFKHALRKVGPGGMMILDNAERVHYGCIQQTTALIKAIRSFSNGIAAGAASLSSLSRNWRRPAGGIGPTPSWSASPWSRLISREIGSRCVIATSCPS